ncbi:MAG TPA: zf-HC2 domain-containing protein [Gemmatimonadaceae bacterium]|nr:zf-HC2 domain-containing protein [Gemmatimonadaceae bacterium]
MQHPDEGTIHSWIDGELSPEQAREIEAHVAGCPECAAMVAEARGLVAASTRILTALDDVPGGVIPSVLDIAPAQIVRRRWYQRTDLRAAAALLFVAGGSLLVVRRGVDTESTRAMLATTDTAKEPSAAEGGAAKPLTGRELLRRSEAKSSVTSPTDLSVQPKATLEAQSSRLQARDEAQSSEEEGARARAADVANPPPAVANAPARAPVAQLDAPAPPTVAAPAEGRMLGAVITGVAGDSKVVDAPAAVSVTAGAAPLRVLRADSTGGIKRTIYEVSKGVEVTLTESPVETVAERNAAGRQKAAAPQSSAPPTAQTETKQRQDALSGRAAGAVMSAPTAALNSISWTERGRRFVLTGRLTTKDLEAVKAQLAQARR